MTDNHTIAAAYLDETFRAFRGYKRMAEGALVQLSDQDFFHLPDPESNSVALVVKHISGNLRSRWTDFLTSDGEKPDRNRDQEFIIAPADTRAELMRRWEESFARVFETIQGLKPEDLTRTVYIRQEAHTVMQAINRSLAHIVYHVGQIVFLGKHLRSAEWKTLSVPRGKSAEYNAKPLEERKVKAPTKG
ncbi:MAG TPA: DUF1572 family protein [Candidatus Angelobacter sp.]